MFVRFSRDYDAGNGVLYENQKTYDLDKRLADRFIAEGAATLSTAAPAGYSPSAVAITGGSVSGATLTGNTISNSPLGNPTRSSVAAVSLAIAAIDSTGTPGNVTNNAGNGRAAFAVGANTVVVTNSGVAAADTVQVTLLGATDATLLYVTGVTVANGSFTVTGNANAAAAKGFMFTVIKL